MKSNQQLRNKAQRYAVRFLCQKYRNEYQELYNAYLLNRGVTPTTTPLVDERELLKAGK